MEAEVKFMVLRQDDQGNMFLVQDKILDAREAWSLYISLASSAHKQTYAVSMWTTDDERRQIIRQFKVME